MKYVEAVQFAADLIQKNHLDKAESVLNDILNHTLEDGLPFYLLGCIEQQRGRHALSIPFYEKALKIAPDMDMTLHNLGTAYKLQEYNDKAVEAYKKRLEADPENAETMAMLAGAYVNEGQPEVGVYWARKALEKEPDNPHARNHLALCLLEQGKWCEGWKEYSRRWEVPERAAHRRDYGDVPKWNGGPTKRLVVHGEQGLGDEIMFLSCLPSNIAELVGELVIECSPRLVPLIRRSFNCEAYGDHEQVLKSPAPTAWLPMGDLPSLFGPRKDPYIKPDPARVSYWRDKMKAVGTGPYVGMAWSGGTKRTHQTIRNAPFKHWHALTRYGTPVSLQYTQGADEEAKELGIPHWQYGIDDLDDQAALIKACDLVISVCQTAIHIAGAVGTRAWVITPNKPAWRYGLTGESMRWYPPTKLYRQTKDGAWPFERIEQDLADFTGVSGAKPRTAQAAD